MTEHVNPNTLVVVSTVAHPIMTSVRGVSYDAIVAMMEEEERFTSLFPGNAYSFKKGHWYKGFGKKGEISDKLFREKSLIVNAPNINFAWRTFTDEGKPAYLAFANPAMGQRLPDRKTLGNTDKAFWPVSELNGRPQDPIQKIAMVPFRFDGEKEVHHFIFNSWSAVRAVQDFMKTYGKEGRSHMGKLPVVNLDSALEPHWDDPSITFEVPVFGIADWEEPIAEDNGDLVPANDAGQMQLPLSDVPQNGAVTQRGRVEKKDNVQEMPENKGVSDGSSSMMDFVNEVKAEESKGLFPNTKGEEKKPEAATIGGGRRRGTNGAAANTNGLGGRR